MVATEKHRLLTIDEADAARRMAGRPEYLEAVPTDRQDLAAGQSAIRLDRLVPPIATRAGGGGLEQRRDLRLRVAVPPKPGGELLTLPIAAVWVADERCLVLVEDDLGSG